MCIAILNIKGQLKDEYIRNSWNNNDQGAGLLYNYKGILTTFKTYNYKEFLKKYKELRKNKEIQNIVLHFRIATSGHEKYTNLHPFLVNDKLGFVHNGIISGLGNNQHSDTYQFNDILKKLPKDFLNNESIKYFISDFINSSKLIFLDNKDNYTIINEGLGHWDNGQWYSNDSYKCNLDYVYYGNEKKTKGKKQSEQIYDNWNVGNENDFYTWDTVQDNRAEIKKIYENASDKNINSFCDLTQCDINSPHILYELESHSYFYNTLDLCKIVLGIQKDFAGVNEFN